MHIFVSRAPISPPVLPEAANLLDALTLARSGPQGGGACPLVGPQLGPGPPQRAPAHARCGRRSRGCGERKHPAPQTQQRVRARGEIACDLLERRPLRCTRTTMHLAMWRVGARHPLPSREPDCLFFCFEELRRSPLAFLASGLKSCPPMKSARPKQPSKGMAFLEAPVRERDKPLLNCPLPLVANPVRVQQHAVHVPPWRWGRLPG